MFRISYFDLSPFNMWVILNRRCKMSRTMRTNSISLKHQHPSCTVGFLWTVCLSHIDNKLCFPVLHHQPISLPFVNMSRKSRTSSDLTDDGFDSPKDATPFRRSVSFSRLADQNALRAAFDSLPKTPSASLEGIPGMIFDTFSAVLARVVYRYSSQHRYFENGYCLWKHFNVFLFLFFFNVGNIKRA